MKKILIADDEPLTREILNEFFTMKGFEVIETEDGQSAWETFQAVQPDAAVLDLEMPKMGGKKAAELILEQKQDFPIIILSGFIEKYSAEELKNMGVRSILEKPVNLVMIKNLIDDIFRDSS